VSAVRGLDDRRFGGASSAQTQRFLCVGHRWSRSLRRSQMSIVGDLDIHRKQLTFDWVDEQNDK
jgi:hypothetical protein